MKFRVPDGMNAQIVLEWNGKKYRVNKSTICDKEHCDLFNTECGIGNFPCYDMVSACIRDLGAIPQGCFKEVK